MHVHVAADPSRVLVFGKIELVQLDDHRQVLVHLDLDVPAFELVFESLHDFDRQAPCGNLKFSSSRGMKVVRFEGSFATIKAVICLHPGIVGSVRPAILTGDEEAGGRFVSPFVQHPDLKPSPRPQIASRPHSELLLRTTWHLFDPKGCVASAIGDECDLVAVGRPPRVHTVEVSIRKRKGIAPLRWHHPELMPGLALIGGINKPLAVRGEVGARFPGGLLIVNLTRLGARLGLYAPKTAGAVNVSTVRDEQQFGAVRRPRGADLMVVFAIVIAWKRTPAFAREPLHVA